MPVYNVSLFVEKAVNSILQQTYGDIELILVDDGSTDGSKDICNFLAGKDSRIRFISKSNQGVSAARNCGLDIASGEYITFVDSDDWLDLDAYEKMIDTIEKTDADIVVMGFSHEANTKTATTLIKEESCVLYNNEAIRNLILGKIFTWSIGDKIYRRKLLNGITFSQSIHCGEDLLFNWSVFRRADKVAYIPLHGYHYVQRDGSATDSFSFKKITAATAFEKVLEDGKFDDKIYMLIKEKYISTIISLLHQFIYKNFGDQTGGDGNEIKKMQSCLRREWLFILSSGLKRKKKGAAVFFMLPMDIVNSLVRVYRLLV